MPTFEFEVNANEDIEDLIDSGGRAKSTINREASVIKHFNEFLKSFMDQVSSFFKIANAMLI